MATTPTTLTPAVDMLVSDVLATYCRGVDRRDWDLVRAAFHPEAVDDHGVFVGSIDGMIDWMTERHQDITSSMHVLGQSYRRMTSPTVVVAETYCITFQTHRAADASDQPVQVQVRCRYLDEITLRDRQWRIAHRTVVFESAQQEQAMATPENSGGARDGSDPSYLLLAGDPVPPRS